MEEGKLQEQPAERQGMFQQPGNRLVQHLQQVPPATEEIILLHIPDQHPKDLHIQDLQTAVSEQHSQELPVPIGHVQGHSLHIQDRQVAQQAGLIRVIQVKVQHQDLLQHLHTQSQVQAGVTHVRVHQAQATVTPVRAHQAQVKVTPVQAARVQAGVIQVRADQVQAEVILHQAAQAAPVQAEATPGVVQVDPVPVVQVDPIPAQARVVQGLAQAVAEGN